jgi:hypothetical protein
MSLSQDSPSLGHPSTGSGVPYAQLMVSAQTGSPHELPAELDGCPLCLAPCLVDVHPLAQSLIPWLAGPQPQPLPSCSLLDQSQAQLLRPSISPVIHYPFPTLDAQDCAQPLLSLQSSPYPISTGPQLLPSLPCLLPMKHPDAICYHPVTQEVSFIPVQLCSPS